MPRTPLLAASGYRRRVASGVTPDQIANLTAWYKADAITGLANGAAVGSWPDSSSNAFAASQATATAKPTYQTGVVNGLPVVRFDGGDSLNATSASASGAAQTLFAVVRPTTTTGVQTVRGATADGGLEYSIDTGKPRLVKQFVINVAVATTTLSTSVFSVIAATFASNSTYAFYLNGGADGSGTHAQTLTAGTGSIIGANGSGGGTALITGDIAELIAYSAVLSGTDRSSVTAYLGAKYGITVS